MSLLERFKIPHVDLRVPGKEERVKTVIDAIFGCVIRPKTFLLSDTHPGSDSFESMLPLLKQRDSATTGLQPPALRTLVRPEEHWRRENSSGAGSPPVFPCYEVPDRLKDHQSDGRELQTVIHETGRSKEWEVYESVRRGEPFVPRV